MGTRQDEGTEGAGELHQSAPPARVLCVDDEPMVLSSLQRVLKERCEVTTATSGVHALKLLEKERFEVLVSDQRMPGMSGTEFLAAARQQSPSSVRILLTGYADMLAIVDSVNQGEVFRYLTKPWKNADLLGTVLAAAQAARASQSSLEPSPAPPASRSTPQGKAARVDAEPVSILVIDRDPGFHRRVAQSCAPGQKVFPAGSVAEAVGQLDAQSEIGVVVSEARLAGSDLTQLLSAIKLVRPQVCTVVVSELMDAPLVIGLINRVQIYRFLQKTVDNARLSEALSGATRHYQRLQASDGLLARHRVAAPEDLQRAVESQRAQGRRGLFQRLTEYFFG
jgi:serine/threonine-protein kinase